MYDNTDIDENYRNAIMRIITEKIAKDIKYSIMKVVTSVRIISVSMIMYKTLKTILGIYASWVVLIIIIINLIRLSKHLEMLTALRIHMSFKNYHIMLVCQIINPKVWRNIKEGLYTHWNADQISIGKSRETKEDFYKYDNRDNKDGDSGEGHKQSDERLSNNDKSIYLDDTDEIGNLIGENNERTVRIDRISQQKPAIITNIRRTIGIVYQRISRVLFSGSILTYFRNTKTTEFE